MFAFMIALTLAQSASAVSPIAAPAIEIRRNKAGEAVMTRAEIRTYNASLPPEHPGYIRCKRSEETGSLVKKTASCRTNAEWRRVEDGANEDARDLIEAINTSTSTRGG